MPIDIPMLANTSRSFASTYSGGIIVPQVPQSGPYSSANCVTIMQYYDQTSVIQIPLVMIGASTGISVPQVPRGLYSSANCVTIMQYHDDQTSVIQIPLVMIGAPTIWTLTGLPARPPALGRPAIMRQKLLKGRKALRRSIDLFCSLRSEAEIKIFLSGAPLVIHGCRFDYRTQKRQNVLRHTMQPDVGGIPYDLHLIERATGKALAKGCLVIPGTPVIDQLLALILHVQDPDEEITVIRKTNWQPSLSPSVTDQLRMAA